MSLETHPLHPGEGVPLFISAGVLKTPQDIGPFLNFEDPLVAPALTLGSYTFSEWAGNKGDNPNVVDSVHYPERDMFGNALGLPNPGKEGMRRLLLPIRELSARGFRTIVSVTNLPHERGVEVIPELVEMAAELEPTAIEINLSCPNGKDSEDKLRPPICNDLEASEEIVSRARLRVGPSFALGIKDAPHGTLETGVNRTAVESLIEVLNPYVRFVTGINTIGNQEFPEITAAGGRGGMSGPVVAPVAREWLAIARASLNPEIPILSCGGVESKNVMREVETRLGMGALLVGGAQEFYRSANTARVAADWARYAI